MESTQSCDKCKTEFKRHEPVVEFEGRTLCRDCHDHLNPICPYCTAPLNERPDTTTACRDCGQVMYIRRDQVLFNTLLLTLDQAEHCRTINKSIGSLRSYGITQRHYLKVVQEFKKETGRQPTEYDAKWKLFHMASKMTNDPKKLASLFYEEAHFVYQHNRDPFFLLRRAQEQTLRHLVQTGTKHVSISGPVDECNICRHACKDAINVNDALKQMPAPSKECPLGFSNDDIDVDQDQPKVANKHTFCEARFVPASQIASDESPEPVVIKQDIEPPKPKEPAKPAANSAAVFKPRHDDAWEDNDHDIPSELPPLDEVVAKAAGSRINANGVRMYLVDDHWLDGQGDPIPALFVLKGPTRGVWLMDEDLGPNEQGHPQYRRVAMPSVQLIIAEVLGRNPQLAANWRTDKKAQYEVWQNVENRLLFPTYSYKADDLIRQMSQILPSEKMIKLFDWKHPPPIQQFEQQLATTLEKIKSHASG